MHGGESERERGRKENKKFYLFANGHKKTIYLHSMAARLYDVSNIIVSGNFAFPIDLEEVSNVCIEGIHIEYKPLRFHAVVIHVRGVSGIIYVFDDGNYVITGARDTKDVDRLLSLCIPILQ
jgi:TATA-box binding protein (TBP) (component of TFIID and TFIIIB)